MSKQATAVKDKAKDKIVDKVEEKAKPVDKVKAVEKVKTNDKAKAADKAKPKKPNKLVRYFTEVRAELRKVIWPSRREATNLTLIVSAVTVAMSIFLGLIDWLLTQLFTLIIG